MASELRQVDIQVDLPLPPMELGKNGRAHYHAKARLYREHRTWATYVIQDALTDVEPWPGAVMDVIWKYRLGVHPDDDAVWQRVAAYRDGAQDAQLVANDATIRTGTVTFERVPKGDEGVVLVFTRIDVAEVA